MPRQKKTRQPKLTSDNPYYALQQEHMALWPIAEQLADRVIATLCCGCEPFSYEDAETELYHHMLKTTHRIDPNADEDRENSARVSAGHTSAMMIAFALGRKMGAR